MSYPFFTTSPCFLPSAPWKVWSPQEDSPGREEEGGRQEEGNWGRSQHVPEEESRHTTPPVPSPASWIPANQERQGQEKVSHWPFSHLKLWHDCGYMLSPSHLHIGKLVLLLFISFHIFYTKKWEYENILWENTLDAEKMNTCLKCIVTKGSIISHQ